MVQILAIGQVDHRRFGRKSFHGSSTIERFVRKIGVERKVLQPRRVLQHYDLLADFWFSTNYRLNFFGGGSPSLSSDRFKLFFVRPSN